MKTLQRISISIVILAATALYAQNTQEPKMDSLEKRKIKSIVQEILGERESEFKIYGFIRHDAMFDTRQMVDVREASVILWPADAKYDQNRKDVNSASQFHMLSILSRTGIRASVSNVLGAKLTGVLEGDYFGNAETGINEFRLRHAWLTMDWKNTQLGFGQFWHPLTIPDVFPGTVNFSGGAPYMPYNRNPQIRLTQKLSEKVKLVLAVLSQRDFTANTAPYINSSIPAANVQLQYKSDKLFFGVAGHFEHIRPKTSSGTLNSASNERLNSLTAMAFAKVITDPVTIKAEATLAQNAGSFIMLGGYVGYTPNDGGLETYKTMNTQAYWIDIAGNGKKWVPGFFAGFSRNGGVNNPVTGNGQTALAYGFPAVVTGIGAGKGSRTINHTYRIAPRIEYNLKRLKFGFEPEYSVAEWGDGDFDGRATNTIEKVENLRFIFATTFTF